MLKIGEEALNGIKFVYFDVGGVFYNFENGIRDLSKLLNADYQKVYNFWQINDEDMCRGRLKTKDFWDNIKSKFRYKGDDIEFIDFWVDHFRKFQTGHDLANSLSSKYPLGIISNIYPNVFEDVVELGLIPPDIKWVSKVLSCEHGCVKPERCLFDIALEKADLKANEMLLIDDSQNNCIKAKELGWKSLVFDAFG